MAPYYWLYSIMRVCLISEIDEPSIDINVYLNGQNQGGQMIKYEFGGNYISDGVRKYFNHTKYADWDNVSKVFKILPTLEYGTIELTKMVDDESASDLVMYFERGSYLPMLNEHNKLDPRMLFSNNSVSKDFVEFHGEQYGKDAITNDLQLVKGIFEEFLKCGGVSNSILK